MIFFKNLMRMAYVPAMLVVFLTFAVITVKTSDTYLPLVGLLLIAIGVSFFMERLIPYNGEWNHSMQDIKRDWLHFTVNELMTALNIVIFPMVVMATASFGVWPSELPLWVQMFLAILIADIGITLTHYWSHVYPVLWKFHAPHHSVKRMYGFNGLMKHPLHQMLETSVGVFPLVLLGISQDIAALLGFAVALQLLLQHSNVDVKIGPLRYVLALSPVHRFHHVKWAGTGDVNFGLFTNLTDYILGTAYYDSEKYFRSKDIGIGAEPDYPKAYWDQLREPFKQVPNGEL